MVNLDKYLNQVSKAEVKYWISHNLKNYLKTNSENVSSIEHILDFLESDKAPKRLKKMSYKEAKKSSEKWVKTMIKKAANVVELDEDTEIILDFEDGIKLVKLVGKAAFEREGKLMSHCVSSYFGKKGLTIYSLRDSNNNPHCTLEITSNDNSFINQIKGKGNGSIHPKYIQYIIKTLQHFKVSVKDSEMDNLGYISFSKKTNDFISKDASFSNVRRLTFNHSVFYYKDDLAAL